MTRHLPPGVVYRYRWVALGLWLALLVALLVLSVIDPGHPFDGLPGSD